MEQSITRWVIAQGFENFMGRFDGRWTRSSDLLSAVLFTTEAEAERAMQALLQEADERLMTHEKHWPAQMWWDIKGGGASVREVEEIIRLTPKTL